MNTLMILDTNGIGPFMFQVTVEAGPCGWSVNSVTLCDSNGCRKSN
jgi:hypothetical protein